MIQEKLSQIIPDNLRPFARLAYKGAIYTYRVLEEAKIRRIQEKLLKQNFSSLETENLIIFLTPGYDAVTGGILAISSTYNESKKLKYIHEADVIMCTLPGDRLLLRYTKFNFHDYIYNFSQVISYFENLQRLIIHIPVLYVPQFLKNLSAKTLFKIRKIDDVHINIMLMNIKNIPPMNYFEELKKIGKVTATTAHDAYTTYELRKKLGFPLHKLGVYISPEFYERKSYKEKENLMIVSPDPHPMKSEILSKIKKQFPNLKIQIIKNIPYENYKKLIAKAKWSITFGEGLDGYFIEAVFSGGISFAVYNSDFFTEDFKSLRTIYDSYETMAKRICEDLNELDNETAYVECQNEQYKLVAKYYNYKKYLKNLELFYKGVYTYP